MELHLLALILALLVKIKYLHCGVEKTKMSPQVLTADNTIIILVAASIVLYILYGVIHRLYFNPLAKFPGPPLAAVTFWYEFYYDVIKRGRYTWKIAELHEKHGK